MLLKKGSDAMVHIHVFFFLTGGILPHMFRKQMELCDIEVSGIAEGERGTRFAAKGDAETILSFAAALPPTITAHEIYVLNPNRELN